MREQPMKEILEKEVQNFIHNIAIELEQPHHQWFEDFGFPIFGETSKDYHEQVYFQSYLESYTRKMINSVLRHLFDNEVGNEIVWPEFDYPGIYNGYTNSECEQQFGFEFIDKDEKIGYRYVRIQMEEIDTLLKLGNVQSIKIILWQDNDLICFGYEDPRVSVICLKNLFQEQFFDLEQDEINIMYDLFKDYISKAVEEAKAMISLTTVPGFTRSYLHKTRQITAQTLAQEVASLSSFYVKHPNYKYVETNSQKLITDYRLQDYFLHNRMEYVFIGSQLPAKCFLTSEYLYQYFKDNPLFDYTPIVSGYIKSIEQLLNGICINYRNANHIEQRDMNSFTLGSYINFVKDNAGLFRTAVPDAHKIIVDCLDSYRIESRNNLFHKDTFSNWDRVETIRKNTIFLYVALLGAVNPSIVFRGSRIPGVLDESYDNLFNILDGQRYGSYTILLRGVEYQHYYKEPRAEALSFDPNGLLTNTIVFRKFDYDHDEQLVLSRFNMPLQVWMNDSYGNKVQMIWPVC